MLKDLEVFSSFSSNDIKAAKEFYGDKLGIETEENDQMGILTLKFSDGSKAIIYPKDDHQPAMFTVLNFIVEDIDKVAEDLVSKGIKLEEYDFMGPDSKGIMRGKAQNQGPDIAWFKDPAGNILSVLQN